MSTLVVDATQQTTAIVGLLRITPKSVTDERGTVREMFRASTFPAHAQWQAQWKQVNLTFTEQGSVRGLHGEAMTKLVGVASGSAFGAWVDARPGSATYGIVVTLALSAGIQVLVPPGVCNGFQAVSPGGCEYLYCFDQEWAPDLAGTAINPLDPDLAIAWPLPPVLSAKDAAAPRLADLSG